MWSHVERVGVRSCSWSLACQVHRNLGASRWHDWIGKRKSKDKMDLRRSRSLSPTRGFRLPSSSTFKTLYVDFSLVRSLAVFFYVTRHPLRHSHSRIQSPITNSFFLIYGRLSPSSRASPPYTRRMQVGHVVITSRTRTNPPLSCARAFHSPIAVVLKHFIYSLRKAPYIPLCRVTVLVRHTSLLSSYLPLLPVLP